MNRLKVTLDIRGCRAVHEPLEPQGQAGGREDLLAQELGQSMESIEGAPVPLAKLPVNTAGSPLGAHGVTAVLAVGFVAELERPGHVREEEGALLIGRAVHAVVHHEVRQVVNYRSRFEEPRPGVFDPINFDLVVCYDVQGPSDE